MWLWNGNADWNAVWNMDSALNWVGYFDFNWNFDSALNRVGDPDWDPKWDAFNL